MSDGQVLAGLLAAMVLGWAIFIIPVYTGWVAADHGVAALLGIAAGGASFLLWLFKRGPA